MADLWHRRIRTGSQTVVLFDEEPQSWALDSGQTAQMKREEGSGSETWRF